MHQWLPVLLLGFATACAGTAPTAAPLLAAPAPPPPVALRPPSLPVTRPSPAPAFAAMALPAAPAPPAAPPSASLRIARAALAPYEDRLAPKQQEDVARALDEAAREQGLPVLMLLALIDQESRFDPTAVGPRGSLGLMQVRPFVGRDVAQRSGLPWHGPRTLFDPVANVRIGARYLAEQLRAFGSAELALAAYNMGPARLRRLLDRGSDRKPLYVHRVLQGYHTLRIEYGDPETGIGG